jgi:hypothetical protein
MFHVTDPGSLTMKMLDDKRERSPLADGSSGAECSPNGGNQALVGSHGSVFAPADGKKPALPRRSRKAAAAVAENTPASIKEMVALDNATVSAILAETHLPRSSGKRQVKVSRSAQHRVKVAFPMPCRLYPPSLDPSWLWATARTPAP